MFKTLLTFLAFLLIALGTHAAGLFKPAHFDYSMWLRVARDWGNGLALYQDTYDNKQPTLFLFVRLIDSADPRLTWYLAESLLAALGALALCSALRRTIPVCAFVAPVLLVAITGSVGTFRGGQSTEAIALWFDVMALSCFVIAMTGGAWWYMLAGGVSFFLMVSFRPPTVLHGLAYLPLIWGLFRSRGVIAGLGLLFAFVTGIALAFSALFLHAQAEGYWEPFLQVMARNLEYGSMSRVPLAESMVNTARMMWEMLSANAVLVALIGITLVVVICQFHRLKRIEWLWLTVSLLWLVGAVAGTLPGGHGFLHYVHHIWPPLCILAVLWLARIQSSEVSKTSDPQVSSPLPRQIAFGLSVGVLLVVLGVQARTAWLWHKAVQAGTDRHHTIDQAARYLDSRASSDAKVPVCVWGDWAELYWRTPRPSVSPCVIPTCINEIAPDMFAEWVDALVKTKPPLLVVDGTMLRPPGAPVLLDSDQAALSKVAPFQRIIDREYVEARVFAHKDIETKLTFLVRKDVVSPSEISKGR